MVEQVTQFKTADGALFPNEHDAIGHEVLIALLEEFPELKVSRLLIKNNIDKIAEIFAPLINHLVIHPPGYAPHADGSGCTCIMYVGSTPSSDHHPDCPLHVPEVCTCETAEPEDRDVRGGHHGSACPMFVTPIYHG